MAPDSDWLTDGPAADYLTGGARTAKGRRKFSRRRLRREVACGKLRAARIGGRGELLFRREWLDEYLESQSTPVIVPVRRRA